MLFSMNIAVKAGLFRNRDIVLSVEISVDTMSTESQSFISVGCEGGEMAYK
jgi:hypothetical protein